MENEIAALKQRLNNAQLQRMRAEGLKEAAEANYHQYLQELKTRFGVDSLEQARDKLTALQDQLKTQLSQITKTLDDLNL